MPLAPRDRGCRGFGACGICRFLLGYLPGGSAWVCTCLLSVLPARLRETRAALFARCPQTFGHQYPGLRRFSWRAVSFLKGLRLGDMHEDSPEAMRLVRLRLSIDPPPQFLQTDGCLCHLTPASPWRAEYSPVRSSAVISIRIAKRQRLCRLPPSQS